MNHQLISIIRRPDGLVGIVSSRRTPFERPKPPRDDETAELAVDSDGGPYIEKIVPLESGQADNLWWPVLSRALRESWEALAHVEKLDARVLRHVLLILTGTLPDPDAKAPDIPPLSFEEPPEPPKATAAHPRAYRGTKYKPPKPTQPKPLDLRPHLCVPADAERLLARLAPFLEEAKSLVDDEYLFASSIRSTTVDSLKEFAHVRNATIRELAPAMPREFRRGLLWSLRHCDRSELSQMLAIYRTLGLDQDVPQRRCVNRLLAPYFFPGYLAWCDIATRIAPHRRMHFFELLIESRIFLVDVPADVVSGLLRADALSSDAVYRHRMFYALRTADRHNNLSYALDGFALANDYFENWEFTDTDSVEGADDAIRDFLEKTGVDDDVSSYSIMNLWEQFADLGDFEQVLQIPDWRCIGPSAAHRLLDIFTDIVYADLSYDQFVEKWRWLKNRIKELVAVVSTVAESHRMKAVGLLCECIEDNDTAQDLTRIAARLPQLYARTCHPPWKVEHYGRYVWSELIDLPDQGWRIVMDAGDKCFRALEDATVRGNDSWLIGCGLQTFVTEMPNVLVEGFARAPTKLFKAARLLGVHSKPERVGLLKTFADHPIVTAKVDTLDYRELFELASKYAGKGISNPVSKRLREHLHGTRDMTAEQVRRDVALMRNRWPGFMLDILSRLSLDRLCESFPVTELTPKVKHAVMMQRLIESNRRSLRRMLRDYLCGNPGAVNQHPANLAWLATHAKIDSRLWFKGVSLSRQTEEHGIIDLELESDALEVLRLGSHFGTCLGVGGGFAPSAAAITLDINKQVVYARTANGRVVARQLLAISQDDRLICFSVYPESASLAIKAVFKEYDLHLADKLGVKVFDVGRDDKYEIESILSKDFWDDTAWDLKLDK